jgi:hypothetical protein
MKKLILQPLLDMLESSFSCITFSHICRKFNMLVDGLSKQALELETSNLNILEEIARVSSLIILESI